MAVDFNKLKSLGYRSIDDLPADMLAGLPDDELAAIAEAMPSRANVAAADVPIDYGKGKAPTRAAIVRALKLADMEAGIDGHALSEAAARLIDAARNGSLAAWREIADRLDGKPQAEIALPAGSEMGIQFVIRGPPVPASREEWARQYGATIEGQARVLDQPVKPEAHSE